MSSEAIGVELPPVGRYHRRLFALCGLAWGVGSSMWYTAIQFMIPKVKGHWGLAGWQVGVYASVFFFGMAAGAPLFGRLSDLRGRRPALLCAMLLTSVMGALSTLATSDLWLIACQFTQGLGVGGSLVLPNLLFGEWCPTSDRGRCMMLLGVFFPGVAVAATGTAWLCMELPRHRLIDDWRLMYLMFAGFEGLLTVILLLLLPESPRWLHVQGLDGEALALVARALPPPLLPNGGASGTGAGSDARLPPPRPEYRSRGPCAGEGKTLGGCAVMRIMFGKHQWFTTLLLWAIWFGTAFAAQGFTTLLPELLKSKGVQDDRVYQDVFVYSTAGVPGILAASHFVEHPCLGRRATIFGALCCTTVSMSLFAWTASEIQLVLYSCLFNLVSNMVWVSLFTYTPEIYPTEIRSQATAACHTLHSFAGVVAPFIGGWLVETYGATGSLAVCTAPVALASIAARMLPRETRNMHLSDTVDRDGAARPLTSNHGERCDVIAATTTVRM